MTPVILGVAVGVAVVTGAIAILELLDRAILGEPITRRSGLHGKSAILPKEPK